ncbi:hypothetical protein [Paraburkholderia sp. RL17-337-BIB-A]|uniref:hypothetical protein n=1 Tax=Paraburkholderia sp. RL17-337-BIB-A TaxID=3031636 RepID=UPI0038BDF852
MVANHRRPALPVEALAGVTDEDELDFGLAGAQHADPGATPPGSPTSLPDCTDETATPADFAECVVRANTVDENLLDGEHLAKDEHLIPAFAKVLLRGAMSASS